MEVVTRLVVEFSTGVTLAQYNFYSASTVRSQRLKGRD
jgi:hypothetical protein